jgi:hypothetical protein
LVETQKFPARAKWRFFKTEDAKGEVSAKIA